MKKIDFLIVLIVLLIGLIIGFNLNNDKNNRYQIVKTNNNTILLDKKTGLTWRNCYIDDKDKIMNYWEEMRIIIDPDNPNPVLPIGKGKAGKIDWASLKPVK